MKINYPNPSIKEKTNPPKAIKSQGMLFEHSLNLSNEYYLNKNIAIIYKKPTPIQITKVDYPKRTKAQISEAYFRRPSTTDYNGIYKGYYLDYEAKETNNLTFSFTHIFDHQINHLLKVKEHGGLAFIIIFFKKVDEVYIMDISEVNRLRKLALEGGKKSISIEQFKNNGCAVVLGYTPPIDYLKSVDQLYNI